MERSPKTYTAPTFGSETSLAEPGSSYDLMLRFIGREKRVVEFGCASGYMSRMLSLSGCRVTGVELNAAAAAEARHYCEDVLVADLDTRSLDDVLPETTFEVAVFGDVLEHLRDPWRVLDDARKFVASGGFVVLSIPNIAHGSVRLSLLSGAFNYKDAGLLDDTHIRFFTLNGIIDLCLRAGYRIDAIDRTRMPIFSESPYLPNVSRDEFDPATIARVCADPEAETFQFVVKATPLDEAGKREAIYKEFLRVRSELETVRRASRVERTSEPSPEPRVEDERTNAEIERLRAECENLRTGQADELHQLASEASEARARLDVERRAAAEAIERTRELEARIADAATKLATFDERMAAADARAQAADTARLELLVERAERAIDLADRTFERDVAIEGRDRAELAVATAHAEAGSLREKLKTANAALSAFEARAASRYDDLQTQLRQTRTEFERRTAEHVEYRIEAHRVSVAFAELGGLHRGLSDVAAARLTAMSELESAIERLTAERDRERRQRSAAHAIFSEYLAFEIANTTYQTTVVDTMIGRYQASKWWALKRLLGKARRKRG